MITELLRGTYRSMTKQNYHFTHFDYFMLTIYFIIHFSRYRTATATWWENILAKLIRSYDRKSPQAPFDAVYFPQLPHQSWKLHETAISVNAAASDYGSGNAYTHIENKMDNISLNKSACNIQHYIASRLWWYDITARSAYSRIQNDKLQVSFADLCTSAYRFIIQMLSWILHVISYHYSQTLT